MEPAPAVEARLIELFQYLGIARAHVAAGRMGLTDWRGLLSLYPERVASLTLVHPPILEAGMLAGMASRVLVVAGDQGISAEGAARLLVDLPTVASRILPGYACQPWSDVLADRRGEIESTILGFLNGIEQQDPAAAGTLAEEEGEVGEISYHIRGAGPPLVLLPFDLAPSQWEPLIPALSAHYRTITMGGPLLGMVGVLEARGRSGYLAVVRNVLDLVQIQPGEVILEVGGGSGVVLREIARRTARANHVIDVDINPYLLREAEQLARRDGLSECIVFQEGDAEAIPLDANSVDVALSFTVLEEGDADRMLSELIRVTRPGGRIAAIVRATDVPSWANAVLSTAVRAKADRPGMINAGFSPAGCADASLYRRFHAAGLTQLTCFPQHVALTAAEATRLTNSKQRVLAALTAEEAIEWQDAVARAEIAGTFFISSCHHCVVGIKRA